MVERLGGEEVQFDVIAGFLLDLRGDAGPVVQPDGMGGFCPCGFYKLRDGCRLVLLETGDGSIDVGVSVSRVPLIDGRSSSRARGGDGR